MQDNAKRSLRLVLDTNVVLDLLHFADAAVSPILNALETGSAHCCASVETLSELSRVLAYPEFRLDDATQNTLITRYQTWVCLAQGASVSLRMPRCSDPDDQMFLTLAAATQADALISKDKALLALRGHAGLGFSILTPLEAGALWV